MSSARYSRNRTRSPRWGRERSVRYRDDRVRRRYRDGDGEPRHPEKVRKLTVTARECLVEVDYLEQSVLIHRDSYPRVPHGRRPVPIPPRERRRATSRRHRRAASKRTRVVRRGGSHRHRAGSDRRGRDSGPETVQLIDRLAMGRRTRRTTNRPRAGGGSLMSDTAGSGRDATDARTIDGLYGSSQSPTVSATA